ncbi:hypothetical protein [Methylomonas sp. AM2-LC]|uniref:hypothetical protein n=1 Tax=Methylomonas sp. AM2-LC TaxID=3153301 RepID=UPI003266C118
MSKFNRILIICPANAITAGPEAIHQLVFDLNRLGQNAAIVYHPFNKLHETPKPYQKYKITVANYQDFQHELIIFPEIMTTLALHVKQAQAAIWWMSVNNYTCIRYGNPFRDHFRYFKNLIKGKRPLRGIRALKHLLHFAQSDYANQFLLDRQIQSFPLSDPIPVYTDPGYLKDLSEKIVNTQRQNIILFNPNKGAKITEKLKSTFPNLLFKPLQGYNREELAEIFLSSKIYIDFGHHPGKDRLPREAAIHGCCVITGLYGSAANPIDLPISNEYKLDVQSKNFEQNFANIVDSIFTHFEDHYTNLENYRNVIALEPLVFEQQMINAFGIESALPK